METPAIKNEFAEGILELSKGAFTEYLTSSRKVTAKPCYIYKVVVAPETVGDHSIVYLRNGEASSDPILVNLSGQYSHPTHGDEFPMYFNRGLYADLSVNIAGITIQYSI